MSNNYRREALKATLARELDDFATYDVLNVLASLAHDRQQEARKLGARGRIEEDRENELFNALDRCARECKRIEDSN